MRQVFLGAGCVGPMLGGPRAGMTAKMPAAKSLPVATSTAKHSQPVHPAAAPHTSWSSHRKHKTSRGTTPAKAAPAHAQTSGQTKQ